MEWVIIGAIVGGAFLFTKLQNSAPTTAAPAPASVASVAPPANSVAAIVPAVVAPPPDYQSELTALQQQVAALTAKPDPLAPKTAPPPLTVVLPAINPTLTAQQALTEAMQAETNLNPKDFDSAHQARYVGEILNWHTLAWNPATKTFDDWSGAYQPGPNLQVVGTGTSMALAVAGTVATKVGSSIASAIPFVGAIISGIIGLFGAISAHHKAAVSRDTNAYNTGLTSVENYLQIIHDSVFSGQSTPQEGIGALDSMYSDFLTYTAPARNNQPYCNSVCEAKVIVNATVIYWKAYFTQLLAGGNTGTGLGTPVPIVAAPAPVAAPKLPVAFPKVFTPGRNQ